MTAVYCTSQTLLNEEDDRGQMANVAIMQALLPHFTDRKLRQGPFFYELSDLHQNNIFVDSEWHIKCLVDLEWACSAHVPFSILAN